MITPKKDKEVVKQAVDRGTFVRAMVEMLTNMSPDQIKIPIKYRDQVLIVKQLMRCDTSGLIGSLLDFAITCALVDYTVETDNQQLTDMFADWMNNINEDLRGQIPTGMNALAKEYFKERWKGSSFILLRSIWEEKNGFILPTKLWFVNGEDIVINNGSIETFSIGEETYTLKVGTKKIVNLPGKQNEKIFVQKPFETWGTEYPIPFIIKRGLYKNGRLFDILATKGEYVVGKALEYLMILKKGSEQLALSNQPEYTYSNDDLKDIKIQMEDLLSNRRLTPGVPTYATNFDTEIEHLIPEYKKILAQELFEPIERRIMAGMGLIDVLQGVASTRKETQMNPRPFIAEVDNGIGDFKMLLSDILQTIINENKLAHPKHVGKILKIHSTPVVEFMTEQIRGALKDMYDRGVLSKRTYGETVGEIDFDIELSRRTQEDAGPIAKIMKPPEAPAIFPLKTPTEPPLTDDKTVPDTTKKTPVKEGKKPIVKASVAESLPVDVQSLSEEAKQLWIKIVDDQTEVNGLEYASQVAWSVVKKLYRKDGSTWVMKSRTTDATGKMINLENASTDLIDNVIKMQEMKLREQQGELLTRLLKGEG